MDMMTFRTRHFTSMRPVRIGLIFARGGRELSVSIAWHDKQVGMSGALAVLSVWHFAQVSAAAICLSIRNPCRCRAQMTLLVEH